MGKDKEVDQVYVKIDKVQNKVLQGNLWIDGVIKDDMGEIVVEVHYNKVDNINYKRDISKNLILLEIHYFKKD